jgi:hypothetical protein
VEGNEEWREVPSYSLMTFFCQCKKIHKKFDINQAALLWWQKLNILETLRLLHFIHHKLIPNNHISSEETTGSLACLLPYRCNSPSTMWVWSGTTLRNKPCFLVLKMSFGVYLNIRSGRPIFFHTSTFSVFTLFDPHFLFFGWLRVAYVLF